MQLGIIFIYLDILSPSSAVVSFKCGRRPTDPITLTLLQQQSRNSSSFTALGRTGERGPAQEAAAQPELVVLKNKYGAQAFSGAVQKDCSPPELLAHIQLV